MVYISDQNNGEPLLIEQFKGINNCAYPVSLGFAWQKQAESVLLDNAGVFVAQPALSLLLADVKDIHISDSGVVFVVTSSDVLVVMENDGSITTRVVDFFGAPFSWVDIGYATFLQSRMGGYKWVIYPDRVAVWGVPEAPKIAVSSIPGTLHSGTYQVACILEADDGGILGGCDELDVVDVVSGGGVRVTVPVLPIGYSARVYVSDVDGATLFLIAKLPGSGYVDIVDPGSLLGLSVPLSTLGMSGPPSTGFIGKLGARAVVCEYEPSMDRSVLYLSKVDNPHLFDIGVDFQIIAGKITVLADYPGGLVVGTDREIYLYGVDGSVARVASFGAIENSQHRYQRDNRVFFWTDRGLCAAPPFEVLTEQFLSVEVPVSSGASVLRWRGADFYLCATDQIDMVGRGDNSFD